MDLLLKTWEAPATGASDRSVDRFVLEMRDWLVKYQDEAEVNLREAHSQKAWYDEQAKHQPQPSQKILLLLPSSNSKLLVKHAKSSERWDLLTYKPNKKKAKQIYHVNRLKEWKEALVWDPVASLLVTEVDRDEEE